MAHIGTDHKARHVYEGESTGGRTWHWVLDVRHDIYPRARSHGITHKLHGPGNCRMERVVAPNANLRVSRHSAVYHTFFPGCHQRPRWRAIMPFGRTKRPLPSFMPRRLPAESRPLREHEPPRCVAQRRTAAVCTAKRQRDCKRALRAMRHNMRGCRGGDNFDGIADRKGSSRRWGMELAAARGRRAAQRHALWRVCQDGL